MELRRSPNFYSFFIVVWLFLASFFLGVNSETIESALSDSSSFNSENSLLESNALLNSVSSRFFSRLSSPNSLMDFFSACNALNSDIFSYFFVLFSIYLGYGRAVVVRRRQVRIFVDWFFAGSILPCAQITKMLILLGISVVSNGWNWRSNGFGVFLGYFLNYEEKVHIGGRHGSNVWDYRHDLALQLVQELFQSILVSGHLDIESVNSVSHSRFLTSGYTTTCAHEYNHSSCEILVR